MLLAAGPAASLAWDMMSCELCAVVVCCCGVWYELYLLYMMGSWVCVWEGYVDGENEEVKKRKRQWGKKSGRAPSKKKKVIHEHNDASFFSNCTSQRKGFHNCTWSRSYLPLISSPLDFVATRTNTQPPVSLSCLYTGSPWKDQLIVEYTMSSSSTNTMEIESSEYVHTPSAFTSWNEKATCKHKHMTWNTYSKQHSHEKNIPLKPTAFYLTYSVIRLIQQFLKENNLLRTLATLQASKNTLALLFTPWEVSIEIVLELIC